MFYLSTGLCLSWKGNFRSMFGTIISCIKLLQGDWTALTCFVASIENNVICIISIGAYIASWSILNCSWDLDGQQSCLVRLAILLPKPPEALWPAGITFTTFPAAAAAGQCWTMMPVWHEYGWKLGIGHWTLCCLHICRNELCCLHIFRNEGNSSFLKPDSPWPWLL